MIKRTPGLLCVFPQPRKRNIVPGVSDSPQPWESKLDFTKARLISKRNPICGFRNRYMWVICMLPLTYQQIKEDWWYVNNLSNMFLGHNLTNKEAKYNESGIVIGDFTSRKTKWKHFMDRYNCHNTIPPILLPAALELSLWPYACSAICMYYVIMLQAPVYHVFLEESAWWLPWWRHQMETFSALLAFCAENSPVPGEFSTQRPVTWSFDIYFDLRLNKRLSKQSWGWWFETLSRPFWRHRNAGVQHRQIDSQCSFSDPSKQKTAYISYKTIQDVLKCFDNNTEDSLTKKDQWYDTNQPIEIAGFKKKIGFSCGAWFIWT